MAFTQDEHDRLEAAADDKQALEKERAEIADATVVRWARAFKEARTEWNTADEPTRKAIAARQHALGPAALHLLVTGHDWWRERHQDPESRKDGDGGTMTSAT